MVNVTRGVVAVLVVMAVSLSVLVAESASQRTSQLQLVLPSNNIPEGFDFFPVHNDDGDDDDFASRFVVSNLAGSYDIWRAGSRGIEGGSS